MIDTTILEELEKRATKGIKWVCRESSTGRGLRIHQDKHMGKYDTAKAAIEAYLRDVPNDKA